MVEIFFGIITKQAIRCGSFHSVEDVEAMIRTVIASYNERAAPFTWAQTADRLLGKNKRRQTINRRR